ncbi:MAG: winged helix-turn-helix transcriptional regulator [Theionarchaea archaeon]|nr:winged helix-turn-helix transcriptional regulator [Theionarchaea archaeon]
MPRKSKVSDEDILELYRKGLTNRQIADELDMTQPAVYYRLEKLQLVNNFHHNVQVDLEQVRILHTMGLTNVGIAMLLRASVAVISQHMRELGLRDNYHRLKDEIS